MKDKHITSHMLICTGALMGISSILMARNFRIAEDKKENENAEAEHEQK